MTTVTVVHVGQHVVAQDTSQSGDRLLTGFFTGVRSSRQHQVEYVDFLFRIGQPLAGPRLLSHD